MKTSELAFPSITINESGSSYSPNTKVYHPGMTLRDWFAGLALQGLSTKCDPDSEDWIAVHAYRMADAMIKARRQK